MLREESRQTVLKYLDERPERLALRLGGGGALLATQLKYLQRARTKLPSYYRARCILPPLAFEQASSEAVAAEKRYGGALCIDLTCGLGVDSAHFSKSFDRVIAVERDPVTARVAAVNFSLLGISNIEVVNDSAEHFIESFSGTADLVYADPARRGEGNRKVFRFEECSPDIVSLLPAIREKTSRVVVKASPLFDIDEAFRLFGDRITVDIVSRQGECKEVLIGVPSAPDAPAGSVRAVAAGCGSLVFGRGDGEPAQASDFEPPYGYLLVPDVSLCKARLVRKYAARIGCYAVSQSGYCLSRQAPDRFFGRVYPIREMAFYQPKKLKQALKAAGISRCNLLKKEFPFDAEGIARALGIRQGGDDSIAFTRIEGKLYALMLGEEIPSKKMTDDAEDR